MNDSIDLRSIIIDPHAIKRAKERFNLKNDMDAINTCKSILKVGQFVGETTCERGNRGLLYASGKKGIIISLDYTVIKTAIEYDKKYIPDIERTNPLYLKLENLYSTEVRKYDRKEKTVERRLNETKIIKGVELAQLNLRNLKTRSVSVKESTQFRIDEINKEIAQLEKELKKIKDEKRAIVYARACLT